VANLVNHAVGPCVVAPLALDFTSLAGMLGVVSFLSSSSLSCSFFTLLALSPSSLSRLVPCSELLCAGSADLEGFDLFYRTLASVGASLVMALLLPLLIGTVILALSKLYQRDS
jgi:hypothetical protein